MKIKSRIDLIHRLVQPTFCHFRLYDDTGPHHTVYDANMKEIEHKEEILNRPTNRSDEKSKLAKALRYTLNTCTINDQEYTCIHYYQVKDENNFGLLKVGYWPKEAVYSVDPDTLMTRKSEYNLLCKLGDPSFVRARWIKEYSGEEVWQWLNSDDEEIDPPDVKLVRIDTSSLLSRAYGDGFPIFRINGGEYVAIAVGFCEDGSGAYEYWPTEKLYSINPDSLADKWDRWCEEGDQ